MPARSCQVVAESPLGLTLVQTGPLASGFRVVEVRRPLELTTFGDYVLRFFNLRNEAKKTGDKARDFRAAAEKKLLTAKLRIQQLEGQAVDQAKAALAARIAKIECILDIAKALVAEGKYDTVEAAMGEALFNLNTVLLILSGVVI